MKGKWRAVTWDIDGTLIDSEPLHERALLAVCEDHIDHIDELDAKQKIGHSFFGAYQGKLRIVYRIQLQPNTLKRPLTQIISTWITKAGLSSNFSSVEVLKRIRDITGNSK